MITILTTTEYRQRTQEIIAGVDRLDELVEVSSAGSKVNKGDKILMVDETGIACPLDWFDTEPPYLIPHASFDPAHLLALVYYKLGNEPQALEQIDETNGLYHHLLLATKLKFGYEIDAQELKGLPKHNQAILQHYGNMDQRIGFNALRSLYHEALEEAKEGRFKSYTAKHYLNLLLDARLYRDAILASETFLTEADSEAVEMALWMQWCSAHYKNLKVPYQPATLKKILDKQQKCLEYLKSNHLRLNAALLSMEACDVANFMGDYPLAKDLINTAIQTFREEAVPDFLGEAGLKKAHLLYHWSKNGSPQYYKAAINAFQDALKIFKKDTHPDYFAEIQHALALIYAEIPAPPEEKPMWTAFSASSFKEALDYYTSELHPYEHARVCHNYATALMEFPPAKLHNNLDKANGLFEDALQIRTADSYPTERALTLLNQVELGWLIPNAREGQEEERFQTMKAKLKEVQTLVDDENLLARAEEQLQKLKQLKTLM